MAVTIQQLIAQREQLQKRAEKVYEINTSAGTFLVKPPSGSLVSEAWNIDDTFAANKFLVYNCITEPDLTNSELQQAFNCFEPVDIVDKIFNAGEVNKIAGTLLEIGGFKGKIVAKLHNEIKN